MKKSRFLSPEIMAFVMKQGYKIYPVTKDNVTYQIEMSKANQKALLVDVYSKKTIDKAINDLYFKIYDKQKVD